VPDQGVEPPAGDRRSVAATVARVTHEIRGPVSTLRGLVATTLAHYDRLTDDERREFLGLMRHEADRLEATVELVSLALRLDAGSLRFDVRSHDLAAVVRDGVEHAQTDDRPIAIEAPDEVPADVDAARIAVAVRQVVENAVRYSPPGAPVVVRVRRDGSDAMIEVVDRGPGVPAERRGSVFERFTDWRPPGYEDRRGSGLGLFVTRAIARAHGGDAWVADDPAGGTMLTVRLPRRGKGDPR
jgi:signal transduction histidine kinase